MIFNFRHSFVLTIYSYWFIFSIMDFEETNSISITPGSSVPGLAHVRGGLGLTQQQVCRRLNLSDMALSFWETGGRNPSLRNLTALAQILCCGTDDLLQVPTEARILEIRANYLERQAAEARAAVEAS